MNETTKSIMFEAVRVAEIQDRLVETTAQLEGANAALESALVDAGVAGDTEFGTYVEDYSGADDNRRHIVGIIEQGSNVVVEHDTGIGSDSSSGR